MFQIYKYVIKGREELTSCSSLIHSHMFPLLDVLYGQVGNLSFAGLGPKYSVLRYFGTRVPILQYSSVLSTRTFKKYLYSYLYSSTFKNKSTFNEYLRVLYEY